MHVILLESGRVSQTVMARHLRDASLCPYESYETPAAVLQRFDELLASIAEDSAPQNILFISGWLGQHPMAADIIERLWQLRQRRSCYWMLVSGKYPTHQLMRDYLAAGVSDSIHKTEVEDLLQQRLALAQQQLAFTQVPQHASLDIFNRAIDLVADRGFNLLCVSLRVQAFDGDHQISREQLVSYSDVVRLKMRLGDQLCVLQSAGTILAFMPHKGIVPSVFRFGRSGDVTHIRSGRDNWLPVKLEISQYLLTPETLVGLTETLAATGESLSSLRRHQAAQHILSALSASKVTLNQDCFA